MSDTCDLERMGRELKCPICLSLYDSAISLTCNHVFCHSCIHKSMKSGSNCPVCKVPYHRREIRPAPHMDNLVNIYKSMEVASGITLFVSQNGPTTRLADTERQDNCDLDATKEPCGETPETVELQNSKGVGSIASKLHPKRIGRNRGKSSFSTNKRVQVRQSPIAETPARQVKDVLGQNQGTNNLLNMSPASLNEHPLTTEKGQPHLSPFFWLREEVERSSQQTDVDQLTYTPAKAPSFSDLKDSDDDVPLEISPEEPQSKCKADLFDSEMFEWTQRACSPELCLSPFRKQVEETDDDRILGQKSEAASRDAAAGSKMIVEQLANVSPLDRNSIMDNDLHTNTYSGRKIEDGLNEPKIPRKRGGKKRKKSQKNMQVGETHDGHKSADDIMQCQGSDTEIVIRSSKAAGTSKRSHAQLVVAKSMNEVDDHVVVELPASSRSKSGSHRDKRVKNVKRKYSSTGHSHESDSAKRKKQITNQAQPDIFREKSNLSNETFLEKPVKAVKRSNSCSISNKPKVRQVMSVFDQKIAKEGGNVLSKASAQAEVDSDDGKSNTHTECLLKKVKIHRQKDMPALRKCGTASIKCAFCHSTEVTEDSGEMVHYSEGRAVLATTEGSVIHSHKSCTEWAPNVYFEDNIVVNLEEELTRSRRIKCSLCGAKGAALGCYEKSCRKSFHIPCAKLLRECRWDTEHFVILCPLHASLELPCELGMGKPQVRKANCNSKGKMAHRRPQVAVGPVTSINQWNCGRSSEKVVLCYSALATAEKEAVSKLAKSSGAVVLGNWNQSVTHVIASTNENGAFKRTLKVLMGILEGRWILSIKWVQACMEATKLVEETPYEITCDIHGIRNGPRLGRLRLLNEQPKLFAGFYFYFTVDFEPSYKGYLQELVTAAGGTVLHRKPITETESLSAPTASTPLTVIVYSIELPGNSDIRKKDMILEGRRSDAEALAVSSGAKWANNSWVLNCIAGHKLQDL